MANRKNSMVRKFGTGLRPPLILPQKWNVGPGQYRSPSEFGYYQTKSVWEENRGIKRRKRKRKIYNSKTLRDRGSEIVWF